MTRETSGVSEVEDINLRFLIEMHDARTERSERRTFIFALIMTFIAVFSNLAWVIYNEQFYTEEVVIEAQQEAENDSSNYIIGGNYGDKADSQDN
jgi:hypothetical protein